MADEGEAPAEVRLNDLLCLREDLLKQLTDESFRSMRWAQVITPLIKQIRQFDLPVPLLLALLDAFEQDVIYTRDKRRYENREELLDYCKRSANPIGRLLLHMYGITSPKALAQSDAVCSALQLINFWQDLSVDIPRERFYLPANSRLQDELVYARHLMLQGAPLVHQVPGRAGWELRLVVQGGLRVLDKVEQINTLQHRPKLHLNDMAVIAWRGLWMRPPASAAAV